MEILEIIIVIGITVLGAVQIFYIFHSKTRQGNQSHQLSDLITGFHKELSDLRSSIQTQMLDFADRVNKQLNQNTQFLSETQQGYQKTIGQVQHRLGELQQATFSMIDIGKDIASLQDILRPPKLRGGFGELMLGELLREILPEDHFSLQYTFRNGNKVDAVIFLGHEIISVDAKFPLENFKRITECEGEEDSIRAKKAFIQDVKKHVDAIATKYILPEEGTFDFALMYIPAENIYYELIIKDEMQTESISAYALKNRVVPVSPNSFYAYLQAIVRGLKGLRIERSAQIILESLAQLETDIKKIMTDFEKVGGHLGNAQAAYDRTFRNLDKLQNKMSSLEMLNPKSLEVEKSKVEE